jgi:hypothetical protein
MKKILAAAVALTILAAGATAANAEPHHHMHRVCSFHHHHRVCHWVR